MPSSTTCLLALACVVAAVLTALALRLAHRRRLAPSTQVRSVLRRVVGRGRPRFPVLEPGRLCVLRI